jgi:hypothetical protein
MIRAVKAPRGLIALAAVLVLVTGCGAASATRLPSPSAAVPPHQPQAAPGGCASTRVTVGGAPPTWAGFSGAGVVPWALGSPPDAVAYLFATQLVAEGLRPDGSSNKVLWVTRGLSRDLTIEGRPLGRSQPVVTIGGQIVDGNQLPSRVDVPTPGCWSFVVAWIRSSRQTSTIDLDVLPPGTLPTRPSP